MFKFYWIVIQFQRSAHSSIGSSCLPITFVSIPLIFFYFYFSKFSFTIFILCNIVFISYTSHSSSHLTCISSSRSHSYCRSVVLEGFDFTFLCFLSYLSLTHVVGSWHPFKVFYTLYTLYKFLLFLFTLSALTTVWSSVIGSRRIFFFFYLSIGSCLNRGSSEFSG